MTPFDLDQLLNKNFEQILKNHLNIESLENYEINVELLPEKNNQPFFNICFDIIYNITSLKNNLLDVTAILKSYKNQKFSLINENQLYQLYNRKNIDFYTLAWFKTTELNVDSRIYSISIRDKIEKTKDNTFNLLLNLKTMQRKIITTQFAENYIIEYKLKNNTRNLYSELKKNLLDNYKEKESLPNRNDPKYKKIEEFEPYELTYNIFYEMAIRNDSVKRILYALNYLYDMRDSKNEIRITEINCHIENKEKIYTISGILKIDNIAKNDKIFFILNDSKVECIYGIDDNKFEAKFFLNENINYLNLYINIGLEKYIDESKNFGLRKAYSRLLIRSTIKGVKKDYKETTISIKIDNMQYFINIDKSKKWLWQLGDLKKDLNKNSFQKKYEHFLKTEEHQIYFQSTTFELIKEFEEELIKEYLIYPNNYLKNNPENNKIVLKRALNNYIDIQSLQKNLNYKYEDKYLSEESEYDGYSIHLGILKDSAKIYDVNTIRQNSVNQVIDHNILNLQLNFNLPKNELLLYLSKIKDNYDNDNNILKSPLELLGEELDIDLKNIKDMDSLEWADTFYIYDYYIKNTKDSKTGKRNGIKIDLTFYHADVKNNNSEESRTLRSIKIIHNKFSKNNESSIKEFYIEVDTINERFKLMHTLIEGKEYKDLLGKCFKK